MKIPEGFEPTVFSKAIYEVKDFDAASRELVKFGDFEVADEKKNYLYLVWMVEYPKNHWNPLSRMPGAKQILGGITLKENRLIIETRTKSRLKACQEIVGELVGSQLKLLKTNFEDAADWLKKR